MRRTSEPGDAARSMHEDAAIARAAAAPVAGALAAISAASSAATRAPLDTDEAQLVEHPNDYAIILLDPDGLIDSWSDSARQMLGFSTAEAVGQPLAILYAELDDDDDGGRGAPHEDASEQLRQAAAHGEYAGVGRRQRRGGERFDASVAITAVQRGGELFGFSCVIRDLTADQRVHETMQEAVRAARAGNAAKSQFLATMTHEIRTPINAILGYAELLDMGVAGAMSERQRVYLDRVRASGRHLLGLVDEVLDLARVEAGRLRVDAVPSGLADAVESALVLVRPQAVHRQLSLSVDCGDRVRFVGDEARVQQILANLLVNAVKFTEPGGRITLSCGVRATRDGHDDHDGADGDPAGRAAGVEPGADLGDAGPADGDRGWAYARVTDTGIGVPADSIESIFEPFVQVEGGHTRVHGGSGLGLAISRRLARLMGGELVVRSVLGEGSTFTLWLPAAAPAPAGELLDHRAPRELALIGHALVESTSAIVQTFARRLRDDPDVPRARDLGQADLEDHWPTFFTDVAQAFVALGADGHAKPQNIRDGRDVQRLLSERHGVQRYQLGFSASALAREFVIADETLQAALARSLAPAEAGARTAQVMEQASLVLRRLLARSEGGARRAFLAAGTMTAADARISTG